MLRPYKYISHHFKYTHTQIIKGLSTKEDIASNGASSLFWSKEINLQTEVQNKLPIPIIVVQKERALQ